MSYEGFFHWTADDLKPHLDNQRQIEKLILEKRWADTHDIIETLDPNMKSYMLIKCFMMMNRYDLACELCLASWTGEYIPTLDVLLNSDPIEVASRWSIPHPRVQMTQLSWMLSNSVEAAVYAGFPERTVVSLKLRCFLMRYCSVKSVRYSSGFMFANAEFQDKFEGVFAISQEKLDESDRMHQKKREHFLSGAPGTFILFSPDNMFVNSEQLHGLARGIYFFRTYAANAGRENEASMWESLEKGSCTVQEFLSNMISYYELEFEGDAAPGSLLHQIYSRKSIAERGALFLPEKTDEMSWEMPSFGMVNKTSDNYSNLFSWIHSEKAASLDITMPIYALQRKAEQLMMEGQLVPNWDKVQRITHDAPDHPIAVIMHRLRWCASTCDRISATYYGTATLFESVGIDLQKLLGTSAKLIATRYLTYLDDPSLGLLDVLYSKEQQTDLQYIRQTFMLAHSTLFKVILEQECERLDSNLIDEEDWPRTRKIRLICAMALLAKNTIRLCAMVTDPIFYRLVPGSTEIMDQNDITEAPINSIISALNLIPEVLRVPREAFDMELRDLVALFFSSSYPVGQRVFLSHRGPDLKSYLVEQINAEIGTKGFISQQQQTPVSFFLDALSPPLNETNRSFLYREMWECTHFHCFLTERYHESKWCNRELKAWRILQEMQPWRSISYSVSEGADKTVLDTSIYTTLILPTKLASHSQVFENGGKKILEICPEVGNAHSRIDYVSFNGSTDLIWKIASTSIRRITDQYAMSLRDVRNQLFAASIKLFKLVSEGSPSKAGKKRKGKLLRDKDNKWLKSYCKLFESKLPDDAEIIELIKKLIESWEPGSRSVIRLVLVLHMGFSRMKRSSFSHFIRVCANLAQLLSRYPLLNAYEDVTKFLSEYCFCMENPNEKRIIDDSMAEQDIRINLLLFLAGVSNEITICQLRHEPLTELEIVKGLRLGMFPCVTGDVWEEVTELLETRNTMKEQVIALQAGLRFG